MVSGREFLQHLGEMGIVRLKDIENARIRSKRKQEAGQKLSVVEILIEDEMLTEHQLRRLTQSVGKATPTCFRCLKRSVFEKESFLGTFICQHCHEGVSLDDRTAGLGDELLPNPPSRVIDKIIEKLATKSGKVTDKQIAQLKIERKQRIPRPSLLELLEEKGIKPDRVLKWRGKAQAIVRKKVSNWGALENDYELACFLCRLKIVAQAGLSSALQKQLQSALNAQYVSLRDMLAKKRKLTQYQLDHFLPQCFDRHSRRLAIMAEVSGPLDLDEDGLEDPDWEDSIEELMEEMEEQDLNVLTLETQESAEQVEADKLNPRDAEQRKRFKAFYDRELKDIKSTDDLKGKKFKK